MPVWRNVINYGRLWLATGAMLVAVLAQAQQPASNQSLSMTGSVVGTLRDGETKLPIRFAEIRLVPTLRAEQMNDDQSVSTAGAASLVDPRPQLVTGSSELDGSLRLDGVPVGDYFMAALKPGYVTPGAGIPINASEDQFERVLASLPVVHVSAGQVVSANLVLYRGAAISGQLRFADGSTAIGQKIMWEPAEAVGFRTNPALRRLSKSAEVVSTLVAYGSSTPDVRTDDLGRYRIFGLPPGKYILSTFLYRNQNSAVRLAAKNGNSSVSGGREHFYPELIPVFAPGTFRRKEARIFEVHGVEQIMDADLAIAPVGLHTLKGRVLAAQDRHAPNAAVVHLREQGDNDMRRFAETEDDGSFQFHDLPAGSYELEMLANDLGPPDGNKQPERFKTVRLNVIVGDHDLVLDDVLMTALRPGEKDTEAPF